MASTNSSSECGLLSSNTPPSASMRDIEMLRFLLDLWFERVGHLANQLDNIYGGALQLDFSCIDTRHIEQIIDEGNQDNWYIKEVHSQPGNPVEALLRWCVQDFQRAKCLKSLRLVFWQRGFPHGDSPVTIRQKSENRLAVQLLG